MYHGDLTACWYPVVFEYAGQDVALVEVALNDGEPISNELIYGSIKSLKIDRENQGSSARRLFSFFCSFSIAFALLWSVSVSRFSIARNARSSFTAISAKRLMSASTALNKSLASMECAVHMTLPYLA